ncbi:uncharacterized protein LOC125812769 [Solanum verrucosum]|uniref:uncharacterized protein LOC125812769 n=1 Tax=Solanum verrucosum TaxID=315347 RepID=UPI0020D12CE6|nr:uncharacterized protein LOC125812769 [Solanum verrucosum]
MRLDQINQMDEFYLRAYERSALYKERMKLYHDKHIEKKSFNPGDLMLLFNSRLRLFLGKLRSKWSGPFKVTQVFQSGAIELENDKGERFKANGQRIKAYLGVLEDVKIVEECTMPPRRKNVTKHAPITASQSESHNDSESSSFEVQINVTPEDHLPRATRA